MNTEHIKEFILLASNLNFSKAAEDSFISVSYTHVYKRQIIII